VAHPISELLTLDKVIGPAGEQALAVLMLLVISIAAGLIARTIAGRSIMRWSENSFFGGLPQYRLVKSMAEGLAQIESPKT
jgi:Fe2+ transport system protein B